MMDLKETIPLYNLMKFSEEMHGKRDLIRRIDYVHLFKNPALFHSYALDGRSTGMVEFEDIHTWLSFL